MQININSLIGHAIQARDGEIGKVEDFYFSDDNWTIRYLIVKTGNWFSSRKVLISPEVIEDTLWDKKTFSVKLTIEQIRNSPNIDTDKPVSRQHEIDLHRHYHWLPYWGSGFNPGGGGLWNVLSEYPAIAENTEPEADTIDSQADADQHLRNTNAVTGYHVQASDGEIGHVTDFIIDTQTWQFIFLVIKTFNWTDGKKVLLPVNEIKEIQWDNSRVIANTTITEFKKSKLFTESEFLHPLQA